MRDNSGGECPLVISLPRRADTSTQMSLDGLPDVILGTVLSYLHWKEKEWVVLAFPSLNRVMNSPLAWENFENNRPYTLGSLLMYIYFPTLVEQELEVIQRFGKYFQSCTLWIYKVASIDEHLNDDLRLLAAIGQHCKQLKSLCVMHPGDMSGSRLRASCEHYIKPIQIITSRTSGNLCKLSLCKLFYSSVDSMDTGIMDYIVYLNQNKLLTGLVCLDFSHGLIFDGSLKPLYELKQCTHLKSLKCPIQSMATSIVAELTRRNLHELYLVSDDHTFHLDFLEKLYLDWNKIHSDLPIDKRDLLNIHYIFRTRALAENDMVANPFVKSLIFEQLSSNIPAPFLHRIADLYGSTLQTLAFCSRYWEFLMYFTDLEQIDNSFDYLGRKCVNMKSFLSCLSLPSSAMERLAINSTQLSSVRVFRKNIRLAKADKPECVFMQKMAQALGVPTWSMVSKGENLYRIPGGSCRFLFGTYLSDT